MRLIFIPTILLLILTTGCAENSIAKKKVVAEIQNVPTQYHEEVVITPRELILSSAELTPTQKEKLLIIEENNRDKYTRITDEIEKTKIVMIQTILKPKMDQKEYQILKKRLLKLDQDRIDNGFASIAKARDVIAPMEKLQKTQFDDIFFHNMVKGM
ncbi:hypothetical protein SHI21_16570 [Bacteriovorax sp. PP10]|uniref:Lipoprotein n=1 Tax=Bacteriovorax antarcticus TaxID=3088717 RepID=A0ABU5VXR5_9BACT|nr:hypothetical protein [Bacteriovorax sp. PP10]MEA9357847.1 hypothetical protein [Bacteriovorax sp. PP10]